MRTLLLSIGLLLLIGPAVGNAAPQPPRPLADLRVGCSESTATPPRIYWQAPGAGGYRAQAVAHGGPGLLTLVAGELSQTIATPCNPCRLAVGAPTGPYVQVSLTISAAACPGDPIQVVGIHITP